MPLRETAAPNIPPEGPALLAARLQSYGASCSILDLNSYRIKGEDPLAGALCNGHHLTFEETRGYFDAHISKFGTPDIIAFSGIITTLRWQEIVAKIVKKKLPKCFLVSGNGLATEINTGLFNWIPELDAIARSEGDDVILVIANDVKIIRELGMDDAIASSKISHYYAGYFLGKHRFVYEGDRPKDLDTLPLAAWDLLEEDPFGENILEKYLQVPVWGLAANNSSAAPFSMKRSITTVSSRGCPYACTFCYRGAQGERNYGMRSAEHIAKQIRLYVDQYGVDFIGFVDDNFAVDKRRIALLPDAFKKQGVKVRWGTHTRMDEADERAYDMAKAGCIYIGFGAESADIETLTRMKKGGFILKRGTVEIEVRGKKYAFPKSMVDAILNCHSAGIHANCTWIMGYPGETLEQLKTSVAFIAWQQDIIEKGLIENNNGYTDPKLAINRNMFTATAYPGTDMFKDPYVREQLSKHFKISFNEIGNPICDDHFYEYVLELDDATKALRGSNGDMLNFSAMNMHDYTKARNYIDNDQVEKILEM